MAYERNKSWGKWLVLLLVVGGAAAGAWWYFKERQEAPPEYQTANVTRGDLTQVVTATGQLGPVLNVQVGSQISGIVKKLFIDYNSVVKSNQIIAEIDPSTYQINVLRAKAQLANSKANLELAEVQARRSDELFTNRLVSASDHDTANAQREQAEAQVQSDEANLKNAEVQLSYCTIYAPIDGVVISRNVDVGQTVAASFNTPTIAIIANDLTKMQIDSLVSEADIGGVATNQDVNFSVDAYPYRTFHGKVSQIRYGAITNQNVINYDCVIEVQNSDLKLLPGMTANVSIVIAERDNALRIPNAALRFRPPEVVAAESSATNAAAGGGPATARPGAGARAQGNGLGAGAAGRPGGQGAGFGAGAGRRPGGQGAEFGTGAGPGGGRGTGGPPGAGRRQRGERQAMRTVYVMPPHTGGSRENLKLEPRQIRVGISDGINTEVLEGLNEGDQIVIGVLATGESSASQPRNPFGGGGFRRF